MEIYLKTLVRTIQTRNSLSIMRTLVRLFVKHSLLSSLERQILLFHVVLEVGIRKCVCWPKPLQIYKDVDKKRLGSIK